MMRPLRAMRLVSGYAERSFLGWLAGRGFLVTLVANQAITPLIGLAVWTTALPGQASISTYFVAVLVVRLATVSYEHHTIANRIYEGELADDLLRPHPLALEWIGNSLATRCWHLIFAMPVVLLVVVFGGIAFSVRNVAMALPALLLAAVLRFCFTTSLALSALWTERAHGVVGLGELLIFLLGGEAAPVPFLPDAVRPWAEVMPFRAMLGFPAELASGSLTGNAIWVGFAWQGCWIALMVAVVTILWRRGVQRHIAVGG